MFNGITGQLIIFQLAAESIMLCYWDDGDR